MRRLFVLLVAPALLAVGLYTARPAEAAGAVTGVLTATMTISPGLDAIPTSQTWSASGTATVVGSIMGSMSCTLTGSGLGSVAAGEYTGELYCSGGSGPTGRAFGWFRALINAVYVGAVTAVAGIIVAGAGPVVGGALAAGFVTAATSLMPVVTETVAGWFGAAGE